MNINQQQSLPALCGHVNVQREQGKLCSEFLETYVVVIALLAARSGSPSLLTMMSLDILSAIYFFPLGVFIEAE